MTNDLQTKLKSGLYITIGSAKKDVIYDMDDCGFVKWINFVADQQKDSLVRHIAATYDPKRDGALSPMIRSVYISGFERDGVKFNKNIQEWSEFEKRMLRS